MYNKLHLTLKMPSMNNCEIFIVYTVHMDFGSENLTICHCVQLVTCKIREEKLLYCFCVNFYCFSYINSCCEKSKHIFMLFIIFIKKIIMQTSLQKFNPKKAKYCKANKPHIQERLRIPIL